MDSLKLIFDDVSSACSKVIICAVLGVSLLPGAAVAFDQPWNGGREDVTTPEPEDEEDDCEGNECGEPDCSNTGSPVYTARGYLVWKDTDIRFPATTNVSLSRTYNSFDMRAGLFGRGWMTAQERNIARTYKAITEGNPDKSAKAATDFESVPIWMASYGRRYRLEETETGCKTPEVLYFTFEKTEDGGFKQVFENSLDYAIFNENGRLTAEYDNALGVTTYYTYDDQGRLARQYDANGFELNFEYNEYGFVGTVRDQADRAWTFNYDDYGRLSRVVNPDNNSRDYGYKLVDKIGYKIHLLQSVDDNVDDHVLDVAWSEVKLHSKNSQRVASYTDIDGFEHAYTYAGATYEGVQAVKTIKTTKQIGAGSTIESQTFYANAADYRIISIINTTKGVNVSRQYNEKGRLTNYTDERGNITMFGYDDLNRRTSRTELFGTDEEKTSTWTYYGDSELVEVETLYNFLQTTYTYDDHLRVATKTEKDLVNNLTRVHTYGYYDNTEDAQGEVVLGKLKQVDGPRNNVPDITTLHYNPSGQVSKVEYPKGLQVEVFYNAAGQIDHAIDENGIVTNFVFNSKNELTSTEREGRSTSVSYDAQGLVTATADEMGRVTSYEYDQFNRIEKVTYPDGSYESFVRNDLASYTQVTRKLFTEAGALLSTTISRVDATTQLISDVYLDATSRQVEHYSYNNFDELDALTTYGTYETGSEATTTFQYDKEGRLDTRIDSLNGITSYGYDALSRIETVTAANGAVTVYENSAWGERLSVTSPDTGYTDHDLDASGNVVEMLDANGNKVIYTYDALNRITGADYAGTDLDEVYVYDLRPFGKSRLSDVSDGSGSTAFSYDDRGLVTEVASNVGGVTLPGGYGYNAAGQMTHLTYPSGDEVVVQYNSEGQASDISLHQGASVTSLANTFVWNTNRLESFNQGEGLATALQYDAAGRLTGKTFHKPGELFTLGLDKNDNILSNTLTQSGAVELRSYSYDTLSRLKGETSPLGTDGFEYDAVGNRVLSTTSIEPNPQTVYQYTPQTNRLNSVGGVAHALDAVGNTLGSGEATFTYNALNRMATALANGNAATYTYNFSGQRVRKVVSGVDEADLRFTYGLMGELLGEYDNAGNRIREIVYAYHSSQPEPIAQINADGSIVYLQTDHLGTPRAAVNGGGDVVWRWDSSAFGDSLPNVDPDADGNPVHIALRFPGQYYDEETGLHYNYFRDYDSALGRYVQADPIGLAGGVNTYAYVEGNPLLFLDMLGLYGTIGEASNAAQAEISGCRGSLGGLLFGCPYGYNITATIDDCNNPDYDYELLHPIAGMPPGFGKGLGGLGKGVKGAAKKQHKGTPGNNQAQNKQFKDATQGLSKAQKRRVHDEITGRNMSFDEIKQIADDILNGRF